MKFEKLHEVFFCSLKFLVNFANFIRFDFTVFVFRVVGQQEWGKSL